MPPEARQSMYLTLRIMNRLLPLGLFALIGLSASHAQSVEMPTKTNMAFKSNQAASIEIHGNRNNPPRRRTSMGQTVRINSMTFSYTRQNDRAGTGSPAMEVATFGDAMTLNTASERKIYFSHFSSSSGSLTRLAGATLPSANRNQIPAGGSPAPNPLEFSFFPSFGGFVQLSIVDYRDSQVRFRSPNGSVNPSRLSFNFSVGQRVIKILNH